MTFFGNVNNNWEYIKKIAREAGDKELEEFAELMIRNEEREKSTIGGW